ncbi:GTA baseplate fiber-binding domain-containing protein [Devosia indica]
MTPVISPVVVAAHLPPLPSDPLRSRLVLGAYADPWPGVVEIVDNATGTQLARLSRPAAIGELLTPLAPGPEAQWDRGNAVDIKLIAGHLADAAPLAALAGTNRVAVETDAGDWEVIGFANAELVAPGQYRLTALLRGLEGSGHAIGTASTGRRMMVLNQTVVTLAVETDWIGESRDLRILAMGGGAGEIMTVAPGAGPALPLSPVHLEGLRAADGSITLEWTRRSRADGDGWGVAEPPLEFAPENWQVEIVTGGVTVRTLSTAQCSVPYPLADQIADLGAPASGFTFSVRQVSAALGAGHGATGEFHG